MEIDWIFYLKKKKEKNEIRLHCLMPWWGRWSTERNEKILIREKIKFDSLRSFWFNLEVNRSHIRTACIVQATLKYTQTDQSRLVHMHLDNLRDGFCEILWRLLIYPYFPAN